MNTLAERCAGPCELCGSTADVAPFPVPPRRLADPDACAAICDVCRTQVENKAPLNHDHLRCLAESLWHPEPAVQVLSWRLLNRLKNTPWARDLLQSVDLDEGVLQWAADEQADDGTDNSVAPTLDSNGNPLVAGDSVTLIKDLVVKGGGFTAKRGTLVKNIALTANPAHVEGRINGTVIVLVAAFLKKAT